MGDTAELEPAHPDAVGGRTAKGARPTDILWLAGALLLSYGLQLTLIAAGHVSWVRFSLGIVWLGLIAGAVIGVALFLAVQFGSAPRAIWLGVALPALGGLLLLPALYFMVGDIAKSIGWGWYLNSLILSGGASLGAFAGAHIARSTRPQPKLL